jgi:hypothetical protein
MNERCKDCKFFDFDEIAADLGSCVRYPPVLINAEEPTDELAWWSPVVNVDAWCGEWKTKG